MTDLTEEAFEELLASQGESQDDAPQPRTLLEVWREVLTNIEASSEAEITMEQALRVVQQWPQVKIQETPAYHWAYHSNLLVLRKILLDEIATDKKCLKHIEDDAEYNRAHYLNLLLQWQLQIRSWEVSWRPTDSDAHVWVAAFADSAAFFLGQNGLIAHLDQIGFTLSDEDTEAMVETIAQVQ